MKSHFAHSTVLRVGVLGLTLMLPFTVRAAVADASFQNQLAEINRRYEDLDYEQALEQVQRTRRGPLTEDQQITLQLYEGLLLCEMGKLDQGGEVFESALRTRPTVQLPLRVPPKVARLFETKRTKIRDELAASAAKKGQGEARADTRAAPSLTPTLEEPKPSPLTLQSRPPGELRPLTQRWYFWAGVGVVAAAVTVGSIVWATSSPFNPNTLCGGVCDDVIGGQGPVGISF